MVYSCDDLLLPVFSRDWIYEWSIPTVSVTMATAATITMTSHQMMWITMVTTQLLSNWFALTDLKRLTLLAETNIENFCACVADHIMNFELSVSAFYLEL